MKYTTDDPENAAAVWSDAPLTSRDAGEFAVYYKVFGDENHLIRIMAQQHAVLPNTSLPMRSSAFPKYTMAQRTVIQRISKA